jgi:hypothetical protein
MSTNDSLPDDVETLKQLLLVRDAEQLAQARAEASGLEALIAQMRLTIEKLKRDLFGPRNERKARLLEQMENGDGRWPCGVVAARRQCLAWLRERYRERGGRGTEELKGLKVEPEPACSWRCGRSRWPRLAGLAAGGQRSPGPARPWFRSACAAGGPRDRNRS